MSRAARPDSGPDSGPVGARGRGRSTGLAFDCSPSLAGCVGRHQAHVCEQGILVRPHVAADDIWICAPAPCCLNCYLLPSVFFQLAEREDPLEPAREELREELALGTRSLLTCDARRQRSCEGSIAKLQISIALCWSACALLQLYLRHYPDRGGDGARRPTTLMRPRPATAPTGPTAA